MRNKRLLLIVAVSLLALCLRLPGLGTFMTADEENWMLRSGIFWHELFRQGDLTGTFLTTHPGATTMWLAGAGIAWQEARLGFDIDTSNIRHFRLAAVLPIAIVTSILIGIIAGLLSWWGSGRYALIAGVMLAGDPYLVGMSQVVHLDALLALLMIAALLCWIIFIRERQWLLLYGSGVLAGGALATKLLPALWIIVIGCLIFVSHRLLTHKHAVGEKKRTGLLPETLLLGRWLVVIFISLAIIWPALITQIDVFRYFQQDLGGVVLQQHVELEAVSEPIAPMSFYIRTLLARTNPLVLGLTCATGLLAIVLLRKKRLAELFDIQQPGTFPLIVALLIYSAGFLCLVSLIAKKGDRYLLPALVTLPLISAWGLECLYQGAASIVSKRWRVAGLMSVLAVTILLPLLWAPHTIAYHNRALDMRPLHQQGWGEGLEQAAAWLNSHPIGRELYIATWYPRVMSHYFTGTTLGLSSRQDERVAFIVTYRNMGDRESDDPATAVLEEFKSKEPVHTVMVGGEAYAWIYNVMGIHYYSSNTGELTGPTEVGQTVPIMAETWSSIDIGLATYSSRLNTQDIILHIRSDIEAADDLRTVRVNARDIADSAYHGFTFEPIQNSAGKTFYVALSSPTSRPGDAITVRFTPIDILGGQMVLRRQNLLPGETNAKFYRPGDIAYRLPD